MCPINFNGAAGGMEAHGVIEMEDRNRAEGCGSDNVVGDEDSKVIKRFRDAYGSTAPTKWSDTNHFKGTLWRACTKGAESVKSKHTVWAKTKTGLKQGAAAIKRMDESVMSKSIADYLAYNFMTNITSHRGDAAGMAAGFPISIRHAFGDHMDCNPSWCKSLSTDPAIKAKAFQRLPYKKPLVGAELKKLLLQIVAEKCTLKICERLQHTFSSQNNESFHNMIASKCNKARAQQGGDSYEGRGHRCICVKNLGHSEALKAILAEQGLQTGSQMESYLRSKVKRTKRRNRKARTVEQKRNRKLTKVRKKMSNDKLDEAEEYGYSKDVEMEDSE